MGHPTIARRVSEMPASVASSRSADPAADASAMTGARFAERHGLAPDGANEIASALRRRRALQRELALRALIGLFVLLFNEAAGALLSHKPSTVVEFGAIAGVLVNGPYWIAA